MPVYYQTYPSMTQIESMAITNITARVQFLDCESKSSKKRLNNLDYHIEWLKQYNNGAKGLERASTI